MGHLIIRHIIEQSGDDFGSRCILQHFIYVVSEHDDMQDAVLVHINIRD